jgi:hypothetical protein
VLEKEAVNKKLMAQLNELETSSQEYKEKLDLLTKNEAESKITALESQIKQKGIKKLRLFNYCS